MSRLDPQAWRASDPATSKAAGKAAARFRAGDHSDILRSLRCAGRAMAAEEISDALAWGNHVRVNRRLAELESAGLVIRTSEQHTNKSGRKAFRYAATAEVAA
ncbi:MAG TPA: hypothetical protein VFB29_00305 [Pseudolabrys sp.]|nr:hypothetical protein [Pseudolabrys sp.]